MALADWHILGHLIMKQHSTHRLPRDQFEDLDLMQNLARSILLGNRARAM
jgi:hypothetical protein